MIEYLLLVLILLIIILLTVAYFIRPEKCFISFKTIPSFARVNTPKKDWDDERRTIQLSNGSQYIIPINSKGHFVSLFDWNIEIEDRGQIIEIKIPKNSATDFASIPGIAHSLISPISNSIYGAVLHDYLYRNPSETIAKNISKADCDRYFYMGMIACGVNRLLAGLMYIAVSRCGKSSYIR